MKLSLKTSKDGSNTIYNESINECYHSEFGAITESMHIFIKNGYYHQKNNPLKILEVGMGTGLNAFLTLVEAEKTARKTIYETIELYPINEELFSSLNYSNLIGIENKELFKKIHFSEWETSVEITPNFYLKKMQVSLVKFEPKQLYDVVYFDAFSPEKQPELWTEEIFGKLYKNMNPGAVLVTYCVKGTVKRALKAVGFEIEKLDGPPGKRHILRAIK